VQRLSRPLARFWRKAYEDGLTGLASMVAYNLMLSIFPLALIALFVSGRVLRSQELAASVLADAKRIFPKATDSTLVAAIHGVERVSTTMGLLALVSALWVGASFWGALDTAFCRIYALPCRSWVRQKLFGIGMLGVVLLFIAASVAVPALQSLLATSAQNLPLGLSHVRGLVYWLSITAGLVVTFAALCATYFAVPKGVIPWRCVWPGALGATVAMGIVDAGFPLYLSHVSTVRIGTSAVFILITLLWFYVMALILLAGAVINELRFEEVRTAPAGTLTAMADPKTQELQVEQVQRELAERRRAEEAGEPAETRTHERRADRHASLKEKLRERAESEEEEGAG
jgi:membrane protein